jgi:hypothetical protein
MSDLKIRRLTENDYETLCQYWKFWRFPAPSREMLPQDIGDSIAVILEKEIVCAGFLYATTSKIYWLEFIVSSPNVKDRKVRKNALGLLIDAISQLAKQSGAKTIYSSLKNDNLINHYLDCGYVKGSVNCTEMIKIL